MNEPQTQLEIARELSRSERPTDTDEMRVVRGRLADAIARLAATEKVLVDRTAESQAATGVYSKFTSARQDAQDAFDANPKLRSELLKAEDREREARVDYERAARVLDRAQSERDSANDHVRALSLDLLNRRIAADASEPDPDTVARAMAALPLLREALALDSDARLRWESDRALVYALGAQPGTARRVELIAHLASLAHPSSPDESGLQAIAKALRALG